MIGRFLDSTRVYADRRMLLLALLGFASGLPLLLIGSTLLLWLKEAGISTTEVALFAAASSPYSFKFLW